MAENSFYRKYRPIQLTDVVGQDTIVKALTRAAKIERFSHAYLFSGALGSGKTSIARILATILTCPNRSPNSPRACGKCRTCIGIHNGQCIDVFELDGATNRSIDDVRHIKETAHYAPNELARKVYIIDEFHKLTPDACAALLKILEEPPPYVNFILCTTDHRKVIKTIVSRCQRFSFNKIPSQLISHRLLQVAEREKIELSKDASVAISKVSEGSLRDALGFLEQISAATEGPISIENAMHFFGLAEKRVVYELCRMIIDKNASGMLERLNELVMASVDTRTIIVEITDVFRNIHLVKTCGAMTSLVDLNKDELDLVVSLSEKIHPDSLTRMASSFSRLEKDIAVNINERWILEAALLNCIRIIIDEEKKSLTQPR